MSLLVIVFIGLLLIFLLNSFRYLNQELIPMIFGLTFILLISLVFYLYSFKKGRKLRITYNVKSKIYSQLFVFCIILVVVFQVGISPFVTRGYRLVFNIPYHASLITDYNYIRLIAIAFVGPILEEFLFRGLILQSLSVKYHPSKAIWITSLLFAIVHINPANIFIALVLGLLFSWVYYRTQTLLYNTLLHITANIVGLLSVYSQQISHTEYSLFSYYGAHSWFVFPLSLTMLFLLIVQLKKYITINIKQHN